MVLHDLPIVTILCAGGYGERGAGRKLPEANDSGGSKQASANFPSFYRGGTGTGHGMAGR